MGTVRFAGLLPPKVNSKIYLRSELSRKWFEMGFLSFAGQVFKDLEFSPSYIVIKAEIVECQFDFSVGSVRFVI